MNAMPFVIGALAFLALAYRFYYSFIATKVLMLNDEIEAPSFRLFDKHNYYPMPKWVVFGHHFAAIAEERFVSLDDIKKDLAQMSKILNGDVTRIGVMGGEPLLHPQLKEILISTRLFFPKAKMFLSVRLVVLKGWIFFL